VPNFRVEAFFQTLNQRINHPAMQHLIDSSYKVHEEMVFPVGYYWHLRIDQVRSSAMTNRQNVCQLMKYLVSESKRSIILIKKKLFSPQNNEKFYVLFILGTYVFFFIVGRFTLWVEKKYYCVVYNCQFYFQFYWRLKKENKQGPSLREFFSP
jgi:hypothetical protein